VCALTGAAAGRIDDAAHPPRWEPDAFGGYSTSHILLRLPAGVSLERRADSGWAFRFADDDAANGLLRRHRELEGRAAAMVLHAWQTEDAVALPRIAPRDADLAARLGLDRYLRLALPPGSDTPCLCRQLNAFPTVIELAEVDGLGGIAAVIPDDPAFSSLYALRNTGQAIQGRVGVVDADIDATAAWESGMGGPVTLAIIDSGVDPHLDLAGRLMAGRNVMLDNSDTSDAVNHGTHVAGTAAAGGDNGIGIAGVCWSARILPVRVVNDAGSGPESDCADGLIWAADQGADVASMSLQYYSGTSYLASAVEYAWARDVVLVAAAGNNSDSGVAYPARWPRVMAVGATDNRDTHVGFSNSGPELDVCAPGANIHSLINSAQYGWASGTSMAAPHVAGLACLIRSLHPELTAAQVRAAIESTCDDVGPAGFDVLCGRGRINARRALKSAADMPRPVPTTCALRDYEVRTGTPLNEGLGRLALADDRSLLIRSVREGEARRTELRIDAQAPAPTTSRLDVTIETGADSTGIVTTVQIWDDAAQTWITLASAAQPQADTVRTILNVPNRGRFIRPGDRRVRMRIIGEAPVGSGLGAYTYRVDHVSLVMTP
jgi:hypothetical protein